MEKLLTADAQAALLENLVTGVAYHRIVTDAAGRPVDYVFLEVNPAFEALTGLRAQDIVGRRVTEIIPGIEADPADWIGTYGRVARGGDPIRFEQYAAGLGRWYNVCAYSPAPDHFVCTFDEITEIKRVSEERAALIARLERQNEELERFAYTASHQLRTPLVTIRGFLGAIAEDLEEGDLKAVEEDLSRISRAASRMQTLLDELLELSRIGRIGGAARATPLDELLDEVTEQAHGLLKGVRVTREGGARHLWGDRTRLAEVLQNLLENAARFMGDQEDPEIRVCATEVGDSLCVEVRDNGIGIEPEHQDRVFRLFERLDPRLPGTGVGLALVKRIVEQHGGRVELESPGRGQGTSLRLYLPKAPEHAPDNGS